MKSGFVRILLVAVPITILAAFVVLSQKESAEHPKAVAEEGTRNSQPEETTSPKNTLQQKPPTAQKKPRPRRDDLFPNRAGVATEPHIVNVGPVGHKVKKNFTIEVSNPTAHEINITKVDQSCGCIKVQFDTGPLSPGESRTISGHVDIGNSWGQQQKYVQVWASTEKVTKPEIAVRIPVSWQYHPKVKKPHSKKRSFKLAGVHGADSPDAHGVVTLERERSQEKLVIANLKIEGRRQSIGHLTVAQKNVTDTKLEITASASPEHPEGRVSGTVTGTIDGLPVRITVSGHVYDGIRLEPNKFQFNRMLDPDNTDRQVEMFKVDEHDFKITSVTVDPPYYSVEITPRHGGGYLLIGRPAEPYPDIKKNKSFTSTITIETTHPKKPKVELRAMGVHVPPEKRK